MLRTYVASAAIIAAILSRRARETRNVRARWRASERTDARKPAARVGVPLGGAYTSFHFFFFTSEKRAVGECHGENAEIRGSCNKANYEGVFAAIDTKKCAGREARRNLFQEYLPVPSPSLSPLSNPSVRLILPRESNSNRSHSYLLKRARGWHTSLSLPVFFFLSPTPRKREISIT